MLRPAVAETNCAKTGKTSGLAIGPRVPVDKVLETAPRDAGPTPQPARPGQGRQRARADSFKSPDVPCRWACSLAILHGFRRRDCENPDKSSPFHRISGMQPAVATSAALRRLYGDAVHS